MCIIICEDVLILRVCTRLRDLSFDGSREISVFARGVFPVKVRLFIFAMEGVRNSVIHYRLHLTFECGLGCDMNLCKDRISNLIEPSCSDEIKRIRKYGSIE